MKQNLTLSHTIDVLTGLRGYACLIVFFAHAGRLNIFTANNGSGQLGVMLFFVLSGFLMAYHYMHLSTPREYATFLIRRIARVYPAYVFAVSIAAILTYKGLEEYYYKLPLHALIQHLLLREGAGVFWTIPVELKFYFLFAGLVFLLNVLNKRWHLWMLVVAYIGLCLLNLEADKANFLTYIEFFIAGIITSNVYIKTIHTQTAGCDYKGNTVFIVISLFIILSIPSIDRLNINIWDYKMLWSLLMALYIMAAIHTKGLVRLLCNNRVIQYVGTISYSFYLLHILAIKCAVIWFPALNSSQWIIALLLTILFASFSVLIIEIPIRKWARNFTQKYSSLRPPRIKA